jgi:hypothetical protein
LEADPSVPEVRVAPERGMQLGRRFPHRRYRILRAMNVCRLTCGSVIRRRRQELCSFSALERDAAFLQRQRTSLPVSRKTLAPEFY